MKSGGMNRDRAGIVVVARRSDVTNRPIRMFPALPVRTPKEWSSATSTIEGAWQQTVKPTPSNIGTPRSSRIRVAWGNEAASTNGPSRNSRVRAVRSKRASAESLLQESADWWQSRMILKPEPHICTREPTYQSFPFEPATARTYHACHTQRLCRLL